MVPYILLHPLLRALLRVPIALQSICWEVLAPIRTSHTSVLTVVVLLCTRTPSVGAARAAVLPLSSSGRTMI